jgi:hypothetical protein
MEIQAITLSECRNFFNEALDNDDIDLIATMCNAPVSTVKKYIKENAPNTTLGNLLSNRIVVHGFAVIEKKNNSINVSINKLLQNKSLPDLTK